MEITNTQDLKLKAKDIDLLYSRGYLKYADYLKLITPASFSWGLWVQRLFLFLGSALLLAGVICFFAFNWQDMGRFLKLSMPFAAFAALCSLAVWRGLDSLGGKVLSLSAGVMIGVFFAVYGQVYQTGADAWQLFATWALFLLPLAVLTRFSGMWLVFAAVLNAFLVFYPLHQMVGKDNIFLVFTLVNGAFLIASEFFSNKLKCMGEPFFKALFYAAVLASLVIPAWMYLFGSKNFISFTLFWFFNAAGIWYFLKNKKNITLIGLSAASLAFMILMIIYKVLNPLHHGFESIKLLVLAVMAIVVFTAAAVFVIKANKYIKGAK